MKNIVLCCDGTANEFSDHNTNVVKLYQLLEKDPARQVTYYHPGVGTMEAVGALTSVARKITKVLGYVIGYGLEDDVRAAYLFLMRTYSPGDRIFMFGFSRGAYTVRAVAALLHMYGLMEGNNEALIPYALRLQSAISKEGEGRQGFRSCPTIQSDVFAAAGSYLLHRLVGHGQLGRLENQSAETTLHRG